MTCDDGDRSRASMFNGNKVPLVPRVREPSTSASIGQIDQHDHGHVLRRAAPRADPAAHQRRPHARGARRERAVGALHRLRAGAAGARGGLASSRAKTMKEWLAAHRSRQHDCGVQLGRRRRSGELRLDRVRARAAARRRLRAVEGAARRRHRRVGRRHGSEVHPARVRIRRRASSPPPTTIRSASPTTTIPSSTSRWSTARRSI